MRKEVQRLEEMDNINDWEKLESKTISMMVVQKEYQKAMRSYQGIKKSYSNEYNKYKLQYQQAKAIYQKSVKLKNAALKKLKQAKSLLIKKTNELKSELRGGTKVNTPTVVK